MNTNFNVSYKPKEYERPEDGTYPMIGVDVVEADAKTYKNDRGGEDVIPQIRLLFLIGGPRMQDGRPFMVSRQFSLTFGPKSLLRGFIEAWKGKSLLDQEVRQGINLEEWCIGRPGLVSIASEPSKSDPQRVFSNIKSIMPLPKGMEQELPPWKDYVRMQDRQEALPPKVTQKPVDGVVGFEPGQRKPF